MHDGITHLENHTERLDYAGARRKGAAHRQWPRRGDLHIARRPAHEAAGVSWKEDTRQHVLDLRAQVLSKRRDRAMALTLEPRRRPVALAACMWRFMRLGMRWRS